MFSFEVVTMTVENDQRLGFFLDHYLRNGARKISVFHDGASNRIEYADRVEIIQCNRDFWSGFEGGRPGTVEDRQRVIYAQAYRNCTADWLLIVDTDELLYGFHRIEDALVSASLLPEAIRIPSAEAIFLLIDDQYTDFGAKHFRVPQNRFVAQILPRLLYPGHGTLFIRGLLGHSIGKQFVRSGLEGIEIGIHSIFRNRIPVQPLSLVDYTADNGVFLCHFDAISYPQWREKWDRRLRNRDTAEMGAKRDSQMAKYSRAAKTGEPALQKLFQELYGMSPRKFRFMASSGLAFEFPDVALRSKTFRTERTKPSQF